ncbi:MAG TPA: cytochrome c [Xanthomonadales bacterium]|nr:cytochrome c [Xanthomonadales bacterium]
MNKPNTMHRIILISAFLLAALPATLLAKGDAASGQAKAQVCQACHGIDGKSIAPIYPDLGGQHEDYLVKALADYRAGRRTNPIMAPMAVNLSDQDIEDLAAWFASQEGLKDLSIK